MELQNKSKSLTKNAAFNVAYKILNVLFPLVSAAYVARTIGPEGVGKVAYAQNIVSYFLIFAALGIPKYGTREIAKCRNNAQAASKLFSELIVINAITTLLCSVLFYSVFFFGNPGAQLLYFVCGIDLVFNLINIDWLYEGEEEYVYITVRSVLIKLLSLTLLFLFVKDQNDYTIYALIHSIGICGNNLFNVFHARKKAKLTLRGLNLKPHLKPILVLAVSSVIGSLYSRLNVTILGWLQPEEVVGFYTNAYKMITIGITVVTAISAVFMPRLSYTFNHQRDQFEKLISTGTKIILFLAVPACLGMMMVADDLVWVVFGEAFQPAALALRALTPIIIIMGLGDLLCYQAIISSGNEKMLIKSRVTAAAVSIVLNFLLIPRLQHVGAAVALVLSELVVNGMLLRHSLKLTKPSICGQFWWSLTASSAAMCAIVLLGQSVIDDPLVCLLASVSLGVIAYFVAALITKNEIVGSFLAILKGKTTEQKG